MIVLSTLTYLRTTTYIEHQTWYKPNSRFEHEENQLEYQSWNVPSVCLRTSKSRTQHLENQKHGSGNCEV